MTSSDEGNIEVVVNLIFFSFLQDGDATRSLPLCNVICSGQLVVSPIANDLAIFSVSSLLFEMAYDLFPSSRGRNHGMYSGFAVRTRLRTGRAFYPPPAMIGWGGTGERYGSEVLYHRTETEARTQSQ